MKIYQSIFSRGKKGGGIGRIENKWTLRLTHIDEHETSTCRTWQYATKQDAKDDIEKRKAELIASVDRMGLDLGDVKTFRQWAEYAKAEFYRPAVIKDGRKVAGVKSESTHIFIDQMIEFFGDKQLAKFSKYDLDRFKIWRLEQGDRRGKKGKLPPAQRNPVKISTANRSLVILKHLLNEAYDAGLIAKNVTKGSKAIDADAESAGTRTLSDAEEVILLSACQGKREVEFVRTRRKNCRNRPGEKETVKLTTDVDNEHLKAIIYLGLDSGLRRGEILTLDWKDIDFDAGVIRILSTNTKTQRPRTVPITRRTKTELMALPNFATSGKVFPFNNFTRSWATALEVAKINDLTFRDLRRTCGTRMELLGIPHTIVQKILGHSAKDITGRHYIAATIETVRMVADRLDAFNEHGGQSFLSAAFDRHYSTADGAVVVRDDSAKVIAVSDAGVNQWPDTIE